MAKVIAQTILAPGHAYPFLAVLRELQRRGHSVTLCVHAEAEAALDHIAGVPLQTLPLHPIRRIPAELGRKAAERAWLENLVRTGEPVADALDGLLARERPEVVLEDPMLWGATTAAEASGVPWASLSHNPLSIRGLGLDVRGPGLRPPSGAASRLVHRLVDLHTRLSLSRSLDVLNALRRKRALDPLTDFRDRYVTAPLIIAATAEPFEYPRTDWPPSLRFVGPLVWEPDGASSAWRDEEDDRPLLLLAGSTVSEYQTTGTWIRRVVDALADEPVRIVATIPTDEVPEVVPANCVVTRFVPHEQILRRAACVICHGGFGITSKALAAGVPVVAIPQALDRFEVARRVEHAGAGVMLHPRRLGRRRVKAAVRAAVARTLGARRVADAFGRAGGASAAADAVEALLAGEGAGGARSRTVT